MTDGGDESGLDWTDEELDEAIAREPERPVEQRASALRERVYATFTGLAIALVQLSNVDHLSALRAAIELGVGILAITIAGLLAEGIAYLAVHNRIPSGPEVRVMLRTASSALASAVVPLILIVLAGFGVLELEFALRTASIVYLVTLGVIAYLGVRRTKVEWWKQLIALGALMALGLGVILLQAVAHGH